MTIRKINVEEAFAKFTDTFSPKVAAELNGQQVKLVRAEGDKVPWHAHDNEDEMFFVLEGVLEVLWKGEMEEPSCSELHPWEFIIMPKGVEHKVVPRGYVRLMLFEPATTEHTGKVRSEITQDRHEKLSL